MKQMIDITQGDRQPTIPIFELYPKSGYFIQILKQSDKNNQEVVILGYEDNIECSPMGIPFSIENLIKLYPDMTHFSIIYEPRSNKNYSEYIGKITRITTMM